MRESIFLLGPRGTGKTSWLKATFPESLYFDLLHDETYQEFLANPSILESRIPGDYSKSIIIDEIQKIPALLNEVHRLIELKKMRFILTCSSARSLRRKGVNLLAGRALYFQMHPLTTYELKDNLNLDHALQYGFYAIEIKRKQKLTEKDFLGLKLFKQDYPESDCYMLYGGAREYFHNDIKVVPFEKALKSLREIMTNTYQS